MTDNVKAPMPAAKALAILSGPLRDQIIVPLMRMHEILESAAAAEATVETATKRKDQALAEVAAADSRRAALEGELTRRRAEIEAEVAAFREEVFTRARSEYEIAVRQHEAEKSRAEQDARGALVSLAGLRSAIDTERANLVAAREQAALEREAIAAELAGARTEANTEVGVLKRHIERLTSERAGLLERVRNILAG